MIFGQKISASNVDSHHKSFNFFFDLHQDSHRKAKLRKLKFWGENTINEGVPFCYSRPRWNSISDDELVFYTPFLVSYQQTAERVKRLTSHLLMAIACKLWWSVHVLKQTAHPGWSIQNFEDTLVKNQFFCENGAFSSLLDMGAKNAHKWFSQSHIGRLKPSWLSQFFGSSKKVNTADIEKYEANEIKILVILSKCMQQVRNDPHNLSTTQNLNLTDLGLAAIHSGVNPVYFTKGCAFLHETLTVACWIGFLLRGRSAYLSCEIAFKMRQVLQSSKQISQPFKKYVSDAEMLDAQIVSHATYACDMDALLKSIHQCIENSSVGLVYSKASNPMKIILKNAMFENVSHRIAISNHDLQVAI